MRDWIVKHMALSYDSKVFGTTFRHLRAVNVLMPLFVIAGLINLFTVGFGWGDALAFVPFLVGFIYVSFFLKVEYDELDWEQKLQYIPKANYLGMSPEVEKETYKRLEARWIDKYKGREKFVEVWRFAFPLLCILLAVLIYAIFGSPEAGFYDQRFF